MPYVQQSGRYLPIVTRSSTNGVLEKDLVACCIFTGISMCDRFSNHPHIPD
ncbi:hypothetical protein OGM63_07555 [Plectonema radiosum NIES-515]|uniref:Uncharacterized protein n=1 Tax=Plectonema radiosum NIES-515 TaxID=2986073 RepID=A0ABT3AWA3_9CYAN|nr:hypothetical protein [Plectonema radiosum]MCV3213381.1 hypothetical protein [Plectonema radiosum NIES-515]